MPRLRIGINALYLIPGGVGGTEIYLRSLVAAIDALESGHEVVVFSNRETGSLGRSCRVQPVNAISRPTRIVYEQFALPGVLRREGIDVVLNPGFTAPVLPGFGWDGPQVTVFHDLQHKRHPEYFRWFDLPAWRFFLWLSATRSTRLIAVSQETERDLARYYGAGSDRVDVVAHGVDERFFEIADKREDRGYLLYASTTHPHKNHDRLLRAFAKYRAGHADARLVLTGVRGFANEAVSAEAARLGLSGAVELKGWVAREELYELFRGARAFVYPSLFEGFGMPVAEAMATGLPVACSGIEPLRGMAGGAAELFDPTDEASVLAGIERVMDDDARRAQLATAGRARASMFRWARCARETLASLERATSGF